MTRMTIEEVLKEVDPDEVQEIRKKLEKVGNNDGKSSFSSHQHNHF